MTGLCLWILNRAFSKTLEPRLRETTFLLIALCKQTSYLFVCLLIHYSFHWVRSSWKVLAFEGVLFQFPACLDWGFIPSLSPFLLRSVLLPRIVPESVCTHLSGAHFIPWSQVLRIPLIFLLINHSLNGMVNSNGLNIIFPGFLDVWGLSCYLVYHIATNRNYNLSSSSSLLSSSSSPSSLFSSLYPQRGPLNRLMVIWRCRSIGQVCINLGFWFAI